MKQLYDLSDEPNFKYVLDIYRSISYKAEITTQIPCLRLDMELRVKDNKFSK